MDKARFNYLIGCDKILEDTKPHCERQPL